MHGDLPRRKRIRERSYPSIFYSEHPFPNSNSNIHMHSSSWASQSASSGSSSPSPRLVSTLRPCGERDTGAGDFLGTKDVFREVVKGRKSWKTLKGGEMVWPPELEAALLEGLASYQPDDSRETRLLGRFPMRNRYISAYIYRKTGKQRTAKQVGSRLQQLRDTCGTKKLQHLLSPCRKPTSSGSPKGYNYGSLQRYGLPSITNSWTTLNDAPAVPRSHISDAPDWTMGPLPTPMYISILPKASYSLSGVDKSIYDSSPSLGAESHPRPIRDIDPHLTLTYYSLLDPSARSSFNVYNSHGLIHTEDSPVALSSASDDGTYYYSTVLVPGFWETLCNHSDPTEFTIEHKVIQEAPLEPPVLYTAVYKFRYPKETTPRPVPRFSPADLEALRDLPDSSSVEEDFQASTPSDHDIFDLSDLGFTARSVDEPGYPACGRSISLPNTPRVGDKELYSQRRGSDPALQQHWSLHHRSSP
ncbi:hypothetical protein PM082_006135 [Marasmius tenuissimus]|nr:hypothetical protein PM082_006135 [Marasmius tenuissimus]